jgi:hypothetical protein
LVSSSNSHLQFCTHSSLPLSICAKRSAHLILTQRRSLSNELIVPATSPIAEANGTTLVGRPEIEPRVLLSM